MLFRSRCCLGIMEAFFAEVYLRLPAELYTTLRAVDTCARDALPSFTMSLGICLARIRRVRQIVDSWQVEHSDYEIQSELASLLVSLAVQCGLVPSYSVEVEKVKMHWMVFHEVAVWSPWASTRREAIFLLWHTQGSNDSLWALWRGRHAEALRCVDIDPYVRSQRTFMEEEGFTCSMVLNKASGRISTRTQDATPTPARRQTDAPRLDTIPWQTRL